MLLTNQVKGDQWLKVKVGSRVFLFFVFQTREITTFQYADGNNSVKKKILMLHHKERTDEAVTLGRLKGIGSSAQVEETGLK